MFDAVRFKAGASPTGWASGAWLPRERVIMLAFWSRAKGNVVPPDAPPWTVYTWGDLRPDPKYDWGYEPPPGPAEGHELGHAWATRKFGLQLGAAFEHSWWPPIVNPPSAAQLAAERLKGIDWNLDCVVQP